MKAIFAWGSIKKYAESFLTMALMTLPVYAMILIAVLSIGGKMETQIVLTLFVALVALILIGTIIYYVSYRIINHKMIKILRKVVHDRMAEKEIYGITEAVIGKIKNKYYIYVSLACADKDIDVIYKDVIKELRSYQTSFEEVLGKEVYILYYEVDFEKAYEIRFCTEDETCF